MKSIKNLILIINILFIQISFSQGNFNLDFEDRIENSMTPKVWYIEGEGFDISLDKKIKFHNDLSLKISREKIIDDSYGMCAGVFPTDSVKGKEIKFSGWIKTQDVKNGYAGLWWRVADKENNTLQFENMNENGVSGSKEWSEVSITMDIDENAATINFGCLMTGEGSAWFDNLKISIDGEQFNDNVFEKENLTAKELDWLRSAIHPLNSINPSDEYETDLEVLNNMADKAKVVALGEVTHGASQIYQLKHRIIKHLFEKMNFDVFSIESNMPNANETNSFIIDGLGDPEQYVRNLGFWTWNTQEMKDLIIWMKNHNIKKKHKVRFTGFDMQDYKAAFKELEENITNKKVKRQIRSLKAYMGNNSSEENGINSYNEESRNYIDKELEKIKAHILKKNPDENSRNWCLQMVQLIRQELFLEGHNRDEFMANNLKWIMKQNPDSKIITWGHNGHIKNTDGSMGYFLKENMGEEYLSIGFAFYQGTYSAVGENGLNSYAAQEAKPGSFEYYFNSIDVPVFILDLRNLKKIDGYNDWLFEALDFRQTGALKTANEFQRTSLINDFDMIIFIKEVTNSNLL